MFQKFWYLRIQTISLTLLLTSRPDKLHALMFQIMCLISVSDFCFDQHELYIPRVVSITDALCFTLKGMNLNSFSQKTYVIYGKEQDTFTGSYSLWLWNKWNQQVNRVTRIPCLSLIFRELWKVDVPYIWHLVYAWQWTNVLNTASHLLLKIISSEW